jgi:hypothetical protein
MTDDANLHPLRQVASHPKGGVDYGKTQLGLPGLQKGELLEQVLSLPIDIFPLPVDVSYYVGQALEVRLSHVLGPMCIY